MIISIGTEKLSDIIPDKHSQQVKNRREISQPDKEHLLKTCS